MCELPEGRARGAERCTVAALRRPRPDSPAEHHARLAAGSEARGSSPPGAARTSRRDLHLRSRRDPEARSALGDPGGSRGGKQCDRRCPRAQRRKAGGDRSARGVRTGAPGATGARRAGSRRDHVHGRSARGGSGRSARTSGHRDSTGTQAASHRIRARSCARPGWSWGPPDEVRGHPGDPPVEPDPEITPDRTRARPASRGWRPACRRA
jgi:hypothetical protein